MVNGICRIIITLFVCWLGITWTCEYWSDIKAERNKRYIDDWYERNTSQQCSGYVALNGIYTDNGVTSFNLAKPKGK